METLAQKIVNAILKDLFDRSGFRQTWDGCDTEIQKEIRESLEERATEILKDEGVFDYCECDDSNEKGHE
jgi:hypothetical protein